MTFTPITPVPIQPIIVTMVTPILEITHLNSFLWIINRRVKNDARVGDISSQKVGQWGGVMSVDSDFLAGHVFDLIQRERYVFITMITSSQTEVETRLLTIPVKMQICRTWNDSCLLREGGFLRMATGFLIIY